ncbi:uncharacterized protein LOC143284465 isoform X2 [Babylonia areolata]|uniref:uncharacterized protein LOC143284465 isoform X2 n=1 Tax=Babylonia areolata TaxID=304850 RepID=UPI003FD5EAFF
MLQRAGKLILKLPRSKADRPSDREMTEEEKSAAEDRELCQSNCNYGCCDNNQCCHPSGPNLPGYSVQVIAVVGACVVTLLLLFLCIVRYRMAAKRLNTANRRARRDTGNVEAGRSGPSSPGGGCPSVCSGVSDSLPGSGVCRWNPLRTLILLEESRLSVPEGSGQIMSPPPYSEHDPQTPQELLPPPYDEVVKASHNVADPLSSPSSSSSTAATEETRD